MINFHSRIKNEFMSHIRPRIVLMKGLVKTITLKQYQEMTMNSYEAKYIESLLSDEAFVWKIKNAIKNSKQLNSTELASTYDEYLATDGINELLKRFKYTKDPEPESIDQLKLDL